MGKWKSEENINHFKNNSYEALAQDFLDKGYDFYVDGFTPAPSFIVSMIHMNNIETISLQCRIIEFENYKEMISILEEMGENNYIFIYYIKPFQMRVATVSSENELIGIDRKIRIREQKLNQLLNE